MNRHRKDNRNYNNAPQDHRKAQHLLEDQALILGIIHNKLEVIKLIRKEHEDDNTEIVNNAFLNDVTQTYYRSLVVDFTALFGRDGTHDSNSLQQLYNRKYDSDLPEESLKTIRNTLGSYKPDKNPIKRLTNYRNKEIAHYDASAATSTLQGITAKFSWEHVDMLLQLYAVAEKAISAGLGKAIAFDAENPLLADLKKLMGAK